jgi:arsenite methyltransferase
LNIEKERMYMDNSTQDKWAQWLLSRRHGGDVEQQKIMLKPLYRLRDRVLEHSALAQGETLLDVGCGDGLIAFGALPIVGESGQVIFSDISQDLLDYCQELAHQMGLEQQCRFVCASADNLSVIETGSADVVTTRSVLIYVKAKQKGFQEFFRVLKPGGRLSIFEPINRFTYPEPPHLFFGYDVSPVIPLKQKILAIYRRFQPGNDPMMDFDERDLISFAEQAGFTEIHLELQVEIVPGRFAKEVDMRNPPTWEVFVKSSPNPLVPTLEEAMREALTPAEIEQFTAHLRPLVESRQDVYRLAVAYLWAVKHAF